MYKEDKSYKRSIDEEMKYKNDKFNLINHDNKAYRMKLDEVLEECKTRVANLRAETKNLRQKTYEKFKFDENIISQAFQRNQTDKSLLSGKLCNEAKEIMDYKMCDNMKRWNLLKYETKEKVKKLEELYDKYHQLNLAISYDDDTNLGKTKEGQCIRETENRLDKLIMKCSQADQVRNAYIKIQDTLHKEHSRYGPDLDRLEEDIIKYRAELAEVKKIKGDAILARNHALADLANTEEEAYIKKNRLDQEMTIMREKAEPIISKSTVKKNKLGASCVELVMSYSTNQIAIQPCENERSKLQLLEERNTKIQSVTGGMNLEDNIAIFKKQNSIEENLKKLIRELEERQLAVKQKYANALCRHKKAFFGTNNNLKSINTHLTSENLEENRLIAEKNILSEEFHKIFKIYSLCKMWAERMIVTLAKIPPTDIADETFHHGFEIDRSTLRTKHTSEEANDGGSVSENHIEIPSIQSDGSVENGEDKIHYNLDIFNEIMKKIYTIQEESEQGKIMYHINDLVKCRSLETFSEIYRKFLAKCPKNHIRVNQVAFRDDIYSDINSTNDNQEWILERKMFKTKVTQFVKTKTKKQTKSKKNK